MAVAEQARKSAWLGTILGINCQGISKRYFIKSMPESRILIQAMDSTVHSKSEVLDLLRRNDAQIRSYAVSRLGLFGSFAKGSPTNDSDVDLLVEFEAGKKTFRNFMSLAFFLEELFRRNVELVTSESISPYMREAILSEAEDVIH